ncbi:MAG TPA: endonuclease/exonuclease/phosphatase family protein [Polyangiaceae bacterium]|jgi:endonuclease/exonuclease/phosphatase family metal-dependent hydrolase|nr:endonuclease/exonuclease/phosphatase family protein [Polyangiaceae bacterium]
MHAPVGRRTLSVCLFLSLSVAGVGRAAPPEATAAQQGSFTLLTYNVAGLPFLVSQSDPFHNMPRIGSLLNLYDVAVVQEDFAYHDDLNAGSKHAFRSPPLVLDEKVGIGDGLNVFSRFAFSSFERVTWQACNGRFSHGSDCLAPKGFTFESLELSPDVNVDLYDLHMDAGNTPGDVAARTEQAEQLLAFLEHRSAHNAVIVAGDTNMGRESEDVLQGFLKRAGLTDSCRALSCGRPRLIDRVMYRSSASVELRATQFIVDGRFVRDDGKDLSDHDAVGVVVHWAKERRVARR